MAALTISAPILGRPSSSAPSSPLRPNRPKLTLNTAQSRNFAGKNSSLRLETLSAVSPTIRNTFINGHEPVRQPTSATGSGRPPTLRLTIDSSVSSRNNSDSNSLSSASTPSTSTTTTSASSVDSALLQVPYKLAHNVKSILCNSPLPKRTPISSFAMSRPMFPAQKRVSFRAPLEEEIHTVRYTMAHSDIEPVAFTSPESSGELSTDSSTSGTISIASTDSTCSRGSLELLSGSSSASHSSSGGATSEEIPSSPTHSASEHSDAPSLSLSTSSASSAEEAFSADEPQQHPLTEHPRGRPRIARLARLPRTAGAKRDSSSDDSDSCPETPVAGRRKKKRVWVWTLGPTGDGTTASSTSTGSTVSSTSTEGDASGDYR